MIFFRIAGTLAILLIFVTSTYSQPGEQAGQLTEPVNNRFRTPRQAAYNFFFWQQPSHMRPEIAAEALSANPALTLEERIELARKLKKVYDARGLYVNVESLPNTPDYADSLTGLAEVVVHRQLPQIVLRRYSDRWLFSPKSIEAIPALYRETVSFVVEYLIDRLPPIFKKKILDLELWQIAGLFLVLLAGFVLRRVAEFFMAQTGLRLVQKTRADWDEKLVEISIRPLGLALVAAWFLLAYPNLQMGVKVNAVFRTACLILLYFSVIWLFYRLVDLLEVYLRSVTSKTESKLDDQLVPLIRKTLKLFLVVIGTIFALQNLDINVTSLLTGLGLGGLAFALAARDTLANFFGSITIFLDKPFQVGDWVIIGSIEGTVEEVGFRSTRIRTFYNSVVSIPNSKVADSPIDNMGLRQYRRIKMHLGLTYSTTAEQMQAFVEGVRAVIQANPFTRKDFYEIHFHEFGSYSLNVLLYAFLKVDSWSAELRERHNILLAILQLARDLGVEFAFPTQTLHVDSFYGESPREVGKMLSPEELARTVVAFGPEGDRARKSPVLTYNGQKIDFLPKT